MTSPSRPPASLVPLGEVARIFAGYPPSRGGNQNPATHDGPLCALIGVRDLQDGAIVDEAFIDPYPMPDEDTVERYAIREGDVLLAAKGAAPKVAWVHAGQEGAVASSNLVVIRPGPALLSAILYAILSSDTFVRLLAGLSRGGSGLLSLSVKDLKGLGVPVPPMEEQERLAALIEAAEVGYREALKAATERRSLGLGLAQTRLTKIMREQTRG